MHGLLVFRRRKGIKWQDKGGGVMVGGKLRETYSVTLDNIWFSCQCVVFVIDCALLRDCSLSLSLSLSVSSSPAHVLSFCRLASCGAPQAMQFSPFKKPFAEEIDEWNDKLAYVSECLDNWLKVSYAYIMPDLAHHCYDRWSVLSSKHPRTTKEWKTAPKETLSWQR